MVGVVAHERGEIERYAEAGLTVLEQVLVTGVRLSGRAEPGELPLRPQPRPVHGRVWSARKREFARQAELLQVIPVGLAVGRRIQRRDGDTGNRGGFDLPLRLLRERRFPAGEPLAQLGQLTLLRLDSLEQLRAVHPRRLRIRPGYAHRSSFPGVVRSGQDNASAVRAPNPAQVPRARTMRAATSYGVTLPL